MTLLMLSQPSDDHIRSNSHTKTVPDHVASPKQKPVKISRKRKQLSLDALLTKKKINVTEQPNLSTIDFSPSTSVRPTTIESSCEVKLITNTTTLTATSGNSHASNSHPKDINLYNYINRIVFQILKSMTFFVTLGNLALIIPSHLMKNPVDVFNTAG